MTMLTAVLTLASTVLAQNLPEPTDFVSAADLRAAGLQQYWVADLPVPPGEDAVTATLVDRNLYVATERGTLVAFDAPTGLPIWAQNLHEGKYRILPPTHLWTEEGPGPTAVVTARSVAVFDRLSGDRLADFRLDFGYGSEAVGDYEALYLGSADGDLYSLVLASDYVGGAGAERWKVRTGGPVRSKPAFNGRILWFASAGGKVYSCIANSKLRRWITQLDGPVVADLILHEAGVFASTLGRSVYRLDRDTGQVIWHARLPVPLNKDPIIAGRTLYQNAGEEGLVAVNIDSGEVAWNHPRAIRFVARRADEVVVLASDRNHLLILDNDDGRELRSMDIYNAKLVVSNPVDDAIYVVDRSNQVVCLRSADVPYLTPAALAEARDRLSRHAEEAEPPIEEAGPPAMLEEDVLRSDSEVAPLVGR